GPRSTRKRPPPTVPGSRRRSPTLRSRFIPEVRRTISTSSRSSEGASPLQSPVSRLRGVGPGRARMLERLGIRTVGDLLEHLPRRYEQVGQVRPIALLDRDGGHLQRVRGRVAVAGGHRPRRGLHITRVAVQDGTGTLWAVFFNQPYLAERFRPGMEVALTGK